MKLLSFSRSRATVQYYYRRAYKVFRTRIRTSASVTSQEPVALGLHEQRAYHCHLCNCLIGSRLSVAIVHLCVLILNLLEARRFFSLVGDLVSVMAKPGPSLLCLSGKTKAPPNLALREKFSRLI